MAENKKSFLLYCDLIHTVEKLPKSKAGELFLHILNYVNDNNPTTEDLLIQVTFEPIKQQLKRDLVKWDEIRGKRSEAGKISANKRKQKQQMSTSVESVQQTSTNPTVTVNDTVNVSVNVNDKKDNKIPFDVFWNTYDKKVGKPKCEPKWNKLPEETQLEILKHLELYKESQPDKQYRKNPEVYLNNKSWNDEIIIRDNGNGSHKQKDITGIRKFTESDPKVEGFTYE